MPFYTAGAFRYRVRGGAGTHGALAAYSVRIAQLPVARGRLAAQLNESLPAQAGQYHRLLQVSGQGRYIGTYLVTDGPDGPPLWLEGDDRWIIDGAMRVHGTGTEDYFN